MLHLSRRSLFLKVISILLKACHDQKKTQRILNQGMPKYGKHIKIRHIFFVRGLADKIDSRMQQTISSFSFIFNKTDPSIIYLAIQPDVIKTTGCFCNHNTVRKYFNCKNSHTSDKDPLLERLGTNGM